MNTTSNDSEMGADNGLGAPDAAVATALRKLRRGKVGRLPRKVRNEVCQRLDDGETAAQILPWLNELEDAKRVLSRLFEGKPVTAQNLSEWRAGGYAEWLNHQERCDRVAQINDLDADLAEVENGRLGDKLSRIFAVEMATKLEAIMDETKSLPEQWAILREGLREIRMLRRGDHDAARLAMQEERWDWQRLEQDDAYEASIKEGNRQKLVASFFHMVTRQQEAERFGGGEAGMLIADILHRIQNDKPFADLVERFQSIPLQPAKPKTNVPAGAEGNGRVSQQTGGKSDQIRVNPTNSDLKKDPAPVAPKPPKPLVIEDDTREYLLVRSELIRAAEAIGITPPRIYSKDTALLTAYLTGKPEKWYDYNPSRQYVVDPPKIDPRKDPSSPWFAIYQELDRLQLIQKKQ